MSVGITVFVTATFVGGAFFLYQRRKRRNNQHTDYYNVSRCAPHTGTIVTSPSAADEPNTGSVDPQDTNLMYEEIGEASRMTSPEIGSVELTSQAAYFEIKDVDDRVTDAIEKRRNENSENATQPTAMREVEGVAYMNMNVANDEQKGDDYEQLHSQTQSQVEGEYQQLK